MTEKPASVPSSWSEGNNNAHNMRNNPNDDGGRNGDDDDYDEVSLEGIKLPPGAKEIATLVVLLLGDGGVEIIKLQKDFSEMVKNDFFQLFVST